MSAAPRPHWASEVLVLVLTTGAAALAGYQLGRTPRRRMPRLSVLQPPSSLIADLLVDDELRNARLVYRPVGPSGTPYPDWLRALDGKSGVYVIKETMRDGASVVAYVGSSRAGRLYDTITRHLQRWERILSRPRSEDPNDPGTTYRRDRVTIAVRVLSPERALVEETRLIAQLAPRDNRVMHPAGDLDEVIPF